MTTVSLGGFLLGDSSEKVWDREGGSPTGEVYPWVCNGRGEESGGTNAKAFWLNHGTRWGGNKDRQGC